MNVTPISNVPTPYESHFVSCKIPGNTIIAKAENLRLALLKAPPNERALAVFTDVICSRYAIATLGRQDIQHSQVIWRAQGPFTGIQLEDKMRIVFTTRHPECPVILSEQNFITCDTLGQQIIGTCADVLTNLCTLYTLCERVALIFTDVTFSRHTIANLGNNTSQYATAEWRDPGPFTVLELINMLDYPKSLSGTPNQAWCKYMNQFSSSSANTAPHCEPPAEVAEVTQQTSEHRDEHRETKRRRVEGS